MPSFPIDQDRAVLVSAGSVEPVAEWVDTPDGRRPSGDQVRNDQNIPLWTVYCLVMGGDRPELVGVRVPSPTIPEPAPMEVVHFERPTVLVKLTRNGTLGQYWAAEGVAAQHRVVREAS